MGRRDNEQVNKQWNSRNHTTSKKKKSRKKPHRRNSTSSASSNHSRSSRRDARTQSFATDRGRSKSHFREESKYESETRKERLKRKEEEAIRAEFRRRKGYGMSSDSESSSDSNQYTGSTNSCTSSESEPERFTSHTFEQLDDQRSNKRFRRFDTRDHHVAKEKYANEANIREQSESSDYSDEDCNPFMRLSQLQQQRGAQDPSRITLPNTRRDEPRAPTPQWSQHRSPPARSRSHQRHQEDPSPSSYQSSQLPSSPYKEHGYNSRYYSNQDHWRDP